ncbi:MAG: hypothetical protein DSY42_05670, partial [Aquifex sp.]
MKKLALFIALFTGTGIAAAEKATKEDTELLKLAKQYFKPLPKVAENPENPITPEKVKLGKMLYYDPRLSKSGLISCNTCHNLARYGVDNLPTSIGHRWAIGPRNAPTVYNAAIHIAQFWDGRAKDVEEQALGPMQADVEMNMPLDELIAKLNKIKAYVKLFEEAYPGEGLTKETLAKAVASFERTIVSGISPFDRYIQGDLCFNNPVSELFCCLRNNNAVSDRHKRKNNNISDNDLDGDGNLEVVLTNLYANDASQPQILVLDNDQFHWDYEGGKGKG